MEVTLDACGAAASDRSLADAIAQNVARLRGFIRRRVADPLDAEDILQEVFEELVEATRMLRPVEQVGAWLFAVARHRITDLVRRRRTRGIEISAAAPGADASEDCDDSIEAWLPSRQGGPEAAFARGILLETLEDALEELPEEQRRAFVAHELEGRSFKELAAESGVPVNTWLSRKRYAVLHLRRRLQTIHDDYLTLEER
ncbi:MAG: RNA polymerase sigma factor [Caldimonas sp.]